ncbi:hypothetical protein C8Q76DRAFT_632576, partial [Earliella scabrosa]
MARRHKKGASSTSTTLPDLAPEQLQQGPRPPTTRRGSSSRAAPSHSDLGLPTRAQFAELEEQYLASLDKSKKAKALISQDMFDQIWLVLHFPADGKIGTPQFRWWVRKMFALRVGHEGENENEKGNGALAVVVHDGKRLAIREHIYDIICVCHERVKHGGRDKTASEIRKFYTWVPKDLVLLFIKHCPTCVAKKSG